MKIFRFRAKETKRTMQKQRREKLEIRRDDFDSLFLWKVFWKLMRAESPVVFFLKILASAAFFLAFLFFFFIVGEIVGA